MKRSDFEAALERCYENALFEESEFQKRDLEILNWAMDDFDLRPSDDDRDNNILAYCIIGIYEGYKLGRGETTAAMCLEE
jgi:hypothetical protein